MILFGEPFAFNHLSRNIIILIFVSAIVGIGIAHVMFYIALKKIGVIISSSLILASTFITAILSNFIFNENLTICQWASGVILVTGGSLLLWVKKIFIPSIKYDAK
jgi:drug/metabolite transporter (DMT)-like permease